MSEDAKKMNKRAPNEIEEQKNVAEGNKSINRLHFPLQKFIKWTPFFQPEAMIA